MGTLSLYDSFRRAIVPFHPADPNRVTIYTCGPTPYGRLHVGSYRRFLATDFLIRFLISRGMKVLHVVNVTDIDDKILTQVQDTGQGRESLVEHYLTAFLADCDLLNIRRADLYPLASQHVDDMIAMAQKLIEKGIAYEKHRSVYVNISKLPEYGALSGVELEKIRVGATIDLDDYTKDNPRDFTLFKRSSLLEFRKGYSFTTPWGQARPGWHIECASMSSRYLGVPLDLHTGSIDHLFPHHENELALSKALFNRPLARHWFHSHLVMVGRRKMSRSAGNVYSLDDLIDRGFTGRALRFFFLSTHYRRPVLFSLKRLREMATSLERADHFIQGLFLSGQEKPLPAVAKALQKAQKDYFSALEDDLNAPRALGAVFRLIKEVNPILISNRLGSEDRNRLLNFFQGVNNIFRCFDLTFESLSEDLLVLIERREEARRDHRWKEADTLREELRRQGVWVIDSPHGPRWKKIPSQGEKLPDSPPSFPKE